IDGRAGQQQVTEGSLVGNGEATLLTTVDQIDPLYVNFTMSVDSLEQMRRAQSSGNVTLADPNKAACRSPCPTAASTPSPACSISPTPRSTRPPVRSTCVPRCPIR